MSAGDRLQIAVWLGAIAYALWRGRFEVRVVAASLLVGLLASLAFWGRNDPYALKPYLVVADLLTLAACAWAAAVTRATWALSAMSFQVLSLLTYVAKGLGSKLAELGVLNLGYNLGLWGAGKRRGGRPSTRPSMKKTMICAGADEIAKKVHEQLMGLSAQVPGAVADAVALSMIAGAAAAYRELSLAAPQEQAQLLQAAVGAEAPSRH